MRELDDLLDLALGDPNEQRLRTELERYSAEEMMEVAVQALRFGAAARPAWYDQEGGY